MLWPTSTNRSRPACPPPRQYRRPCQRSNSLRFWPARTGRARGRSNATARRFGRRCSSCAFHWLELPASECANTTGRSSSPAPSEMPVGPSEPAIACTRIPEPASGPGGCPTHASRCNGDMLARPGRPQLENRSIHGTALDMGARQIADAHQKLAHDLTAGEAERLLEELDPLLLRAWMMRGQPAGERPVRLPELQDPSWHWQWRHPPSAGCG